MAHIQWKDRYNINFREIDAQHHGLLDILNELIDLLDDHGHPEQVSRIFRNLSDYAHTHFSSEERYMEAANYPKLPQHRIEHASFVARVHELNRTYDPSDPHLVDHTLVFLKHWYLDHITKVDQDYGPFLKMALPTSSIEAVIFGLDGVVCTRELTPLIKLISDQSGKSEDQVRGALQEDPALLRKLETGAIDPDQFHSELTAWAGSSLPREALIQAYGSCFLPAPAMIQLARKLKAYQPVALVGNAAPWLRSQKLPQAEFHSAFSAEAFSCEVGAEFPDKELLLKVVAQLNLPPEACLLIHQDAFCLDASQPPRLQTLHYTRPVMLMSELRHMGVAF
jgi:hemerythrin